MRTNTLCLAVSLLLVSGTATISATQYNGAGAPATVRADKTSALSAMVGKKVVGKSNEFLGTIVSVNDLDKTVELKSETGAIVGIEAGLLNVEGDHLRAASMSRGDVLALFREKGKAGVVEVDAKPLPGKTTETNAGSSTSK